MAASVEHKFLKNLVTSPLPTNTAGTPPVVTVLLENTLIKPEDIESIAVAINGQLIKLHSTEPTGAYSKYYYECLVNNAAYVATPVSNIEADCSLTLTIHANPDFVTAGYVNTGLHQLANFNDTDVFYISFYHTVLRDA